VQADELHLKDLHNLSVLLEREMPDEKMDPRSIARFQTGLMQFMESALGPNVSSSFHLYLCDAIACGNSMDQ
jgi:hypothetical protein